MREPVRLILAGWKADNADALEYRLRRLIVLAPLQGDEAEEATAAFLVWLLMTSAKAQG
jgi:hypothetical protein